MERGRFPIKFSLLWAANLAVLAAIYFAGGARMPILISVQDRGAVLSGMALLENALFSKLKGE